MSIQNLDFTDLVSAKQLSDFLTTTIRNQVKNKQRDEDRVGLENEIRHFSLEDPDAPQFAKAVTSLFGNNGQTVILDAMDYWELRDRVQEYQQEMNISSIFFRKVEFKDEVFFYPTNADQLLPMPQDIGILARHKDRIVNYYLDFVRLYHIPLRELFWDGNDEDSKDASVERLLEVASQSKIAHLFTWGENRPVWTGGWDGEPTRICEYFSDYQLTLSDGLEDMSKEDQEVNSVTFSAYTKLTV